MTTIGYIRVSTDDQDVDKQRHLLLEYSQKHKILIDQFIDVEISSRKSQDARRISEVKALLKSGDLLLVAELSRLGRNMLETLNLINEFAERGIQIIFIRQPELSTAGPQSKLLTAIYSYFAEAERDFISIRTKQALAAVKANGTPLGRRVGSRNKSRPLDPFRTEIEKYLRMELSTSAIMKLINEHLDKPLTYNSYVYFIHHDEKLRDVQPAAGNKPSGEKEPQ
jgi:DNA invertase Pin-like site-specific DNA recombinase